MLIWLVKRVHKSFMADLSTLLTDCYMVIQGVFLGRIENKPYLCSKYLLIPSKMNNSSLRILSLLILLVTTVCQAQYYVSEHILINEGLSNNFVRDLVLDKKGRLWIATESGLNVYSGQTFSNYNVSNSALSANMVNCLWYEAQRYRLWVGTKGAGIGCLQTDTGETACYNTPDSTLSNVLCITPAAGGNLWLIAPTRIMTLSPASGSINDIDLPSRDVYFRCGVDDGNGNLIIGSYMQGASVLNVHTHRFSPLTMNDTSLNRVNVNHVKKDHTGRIWLATNVGLWYYVPGSSQLVEFPHLQRMEIFNIEEIDNRELWLATNRGVMVVDIYTGEVGPLNAKGIIPLLQNIRTIYQDRYKNVWVGNDGMGVEFISHRPPYFEKIHSSPFWGIYVEGNTTWVGTRNHVLGFEGVNQTQDYDISARGTNYGPIFSVNGDGGDWLYLAVPYHCLAFNKQTQQIVTITTSDHHEIEALTFYREPKGTLWITATDGVYTLQDNFTAQLSPINQVLNRQSANGIRRDSQGKLWVATYENGLYLFDGDDKLIKELSQQTGFFSNSIQHLKFDSRNRLWLSTPDGPCCIPDTRFPEQYISYGHHEGLQDTYVRAIQEDRKGNIWMSTNNGISMLDPIDQTFVNYSQADYIPVNNFNGGAVMQADGGIVFTSMEGLCHCYPDSLTTHREAVPVHVLSVQVLESGEEGSGQHLILPDGKGVYHLGPNQGSFRLLFGAEDYAQNHYLEYECKIDGLNQQWIPFKEGSVVFRNLRPGKYPINVRARLKGQPWSDRNIIRATFNIHHPWWASLGAKIIYFMLFVLTIIIFILHYRHRLRLKTELELERQKNIDEQTRHAERLQFFSNITHELKTPITLIQAPLEELLHNGHLNESDKKRIQLVYDSSLRLTDLCNKLLDFRKSETHNNHLTVSKGNLGQLIREIGQSFVELNTNPQLDITVETADDEVPILFDADLVRAMVTNLMSNALKYTLSGNINLIHRQWDENGHGRSSITVSDTGYGIPEESLPHIFDRYYKVQGPHQASGTGIGLAIVRSMAELHKVNIKAESKEGVGTKFTLLFDNAQTYPEAMHAQGIEEKTNVEEPPCESLPASKDEGRQVILLVEDDYQILHFMADSLGTDYNILMAHHGQEGLDLAFEHIPDIIITDLMMPVMDGNTMCRRLKNDVRTSHIPVIMLTAKDTTDDQIAGYADGADSYLTKPFSILMLRTRLDNILHARQQLVQWLNTQSLLPTSPMVENNAPTVDNMLARLSTYDQNFLQDVRAYIVGHLEADNIRMEDIAQSLRISHSTLYRKIKALTGLSGTEYIRKVRILHSVELMHKEHCNVSEAAYRCGFSNLAYFRSAFREVYGMNPSEYLKQ